jgi:hypothetical protein
MSPHANSSPNSDRYIAQKIIKTCLSSHFPLASLFLPSQRSSFTRTSFLIAVQSSSLRPAAHVSCTSPSKELSLSLTSTSNRTSLPLPNLQKLSLLASLSSFLVYLTPPLNTTHPQECLKSASDLRSSPHQLSARTWPEP